jgi:hypothetical protein
MTAEGPFLKSPVWDYRGLTVTAMAPGLTWKVPGDEFARIRPAESVAAGRRR